MGGAAVQTRSRGVHRQKMALALNLRCSVLRARRGPLNVAAAKVAVPPGIEQRLASGARPECLYRLQMQPAPRVMQEPSIG